jgi:hypothetical protein
LGEFEFHYLIRDNDHARSAGRVRVLVGRDNHAPVALNDGASVAAGRAVDIPVLENDQDPDGDPLSITEVTRPANGDIVNQGDYIRYIPAAGFTGSDSFLYTAEDGRGGRARAKVGVYVKPDTAGAGG